MSRNPKAKTREEVDLLIVNANELVTVAAADGKPRTRKQLLDLGIIKDGAMAVKEGRITGVGKTAEVQKLYRADNVISANGKTIMPGFIDPHTHLLFTGSREDEFQMRVEGASYLEILNSGGGILRTVKDTRRASVEKLVDVGIERLDLMLEHGTTTVEAKSGYGLDSRDELKILEAIRRVNQLHTVDVVSTFLGAHAVPIEYKGNVKDYVNLVIDEMIPKVAEKILAEFCDVFCERGAFTLEQTRRILLAGKSHGLRAKVHADEMTTLGGAELAADVGAVSADHLLFASREGIKAMAERSIVAVLLPAAAFSLMMNKYPDARSMIDAGVPIALGTDFNPSCLIENMQLVISFACHFMRLTPAEAITAATINAAHALNRAHDIGSLEIGKRADAVVLDVPNHKFLGCKTGINLVDKVVKNGRVVFDSEAGPSKLVHLED